MPRLTVKHLGQILLLTLAVTLLIGAGDENTRFTDLGHKLMCACGCRQVLLECNHVGCQYSDRMRAELMAAVERGDSDDLTLQGFVQKYGPTVLAAPTTTGFNRVAWIMPYFALLLGITGTIVLVRAWRNRPAAAPSGISPRPNSADLDEFRQRARQETEL
jgi:cytochrome c-type biogenesis protein CcmH/NrfF